MPKRARFWVVGLAVLSLLAAVSLGVLIALGAASALRALAATMTVTFAFGALQHRERALVQAKAAAWSSSASTGERDERSPDGEESGEVDWERFYAELWAYQRQRAPRRRRRLI